MERIDHERMASTSSSTDQARESPYARRIVESRAWTILLWLACAWLCGNALYVYLALDGARTYRIETAAFIWATLLLARGIGGSRGTVPLTDLGTPFAWGLAAVATAGWLAVFVPLIDYPFLSDDYVFLGRYQGPGTILDSRTFFRPMFALVFVAGRSIGGDAAAAFHILGLILHLASAALLGYLVLSKLRNHAAGAVAFSLFLTNPLQLEATLWVSGLQDLLWVFFVCAAAVIYFRDDGPTFGRALAAAPLLCAALLSKETAISFVPVFLLVDWSLGRLRRGRDPVLSYALFLVMVLGYLGVRSYFVAPEQDFLSAPTRYFAKQFVGLPFRFFLMPWSADAVDLPAVVPAAVVVSSAMLVTASVLARRVPHAVFVGLLTMLFAALPVYSYFFVQPNLMSARYLYGPAAGWAIAMAAFLPANVRRPSILGLVVAALTVAQVAALAANSRPWYTAADVIARMRDAVREGRDPGQALRDFEAARGVTVRRRGELPVDYQGVFILLNGYPEFVAFVRGR